MDLKENEVIETLKGSGYKIIQDKKRFCFGIDAVLLADYAEIHKGDNVYDLGTGTGIIPLLIAHSSKAEYITALEIQKDSSDMANRSVTLNKLNHKIQIVNGDIKNVSSLFEKAKADVVICNPPYMIFQHGKQNPLDYKAIARHEVLCTLEDVIKAAEYLLKPQGRFYMIHRPFRLSEIFITLSKYNLEPKKMQLIQPFVNKEPNMVLIEAKKFARPRITVQSPLIVYDSPGVYTSQTQEIYKRQEIGI